LSRKVQFGRKTWKERASLALNQYRTTSCGLNQYRTTSCGLEEFKIKTQLSLWVRTQFSFLREWLHEAQLGEAGVEKLDSNSGNENVLETKKNVMEFARLHARTWSQKQLPSFS
jgi:hypothetical protein